MKLEDTIMHLVLNRHCRHCLIAVLCTLQLHCCGVSNYSDWVRLSPQRTIPTSCCVDPNSCVTANYSDVYQEVL